MLKRFDLNFVRGEQEHAFVMFFDENKPNHKTVRDSLASGSFYEPDVSHFLMRCLRAGDVFVDIGANQGYFTLLGASLVGSTGKVFACEPGENNLQDLERNLRGNTSMDVTVVKTPITDKAGPVSFFLNADDSGGNAIWDVTDWPTNHKSKANPRVQTLEGRTLESLLKEIGAPVRCIKIDTEGAEHMIVQGGYDAIVAQPPEFIITELHEFGLEKLGSSQMKLRETMHALGYECFVLGWGGAAPKYVQPTTIIRAPFIINLLFAAHKNVADLFPEDIVDPRYF